MTKPDSTTLTWEIQNFANLTVVQASSTFKTKQEKFWLRFYPKDDLKGMDNHIAIYLTRATPHTTDLKVLWTISLINDIGKEGYSKALETYYTAESGYNAIPGSLYRLHRDTILEPFFGLLSGGHILIVKCTVTILDDQISMNFAKLSIDDKKITLVHKKAFENYQSLLESSKLSDVVFVVGEKQFELHKAILASQSPVFAAMFGNDLEEAKQNRVEITDVDVEVFEAMIRFIYSGNVDSVDQYALELFVAADKYQLDTLKDMCADFLGSNLSIETVANILLVADMHSDEELKSKCVQYINENASKVMATEGWKQLVESRFELVLELYRDLVVMFEKNK